MMFVRRLGQLLVQQCCQGETCDLFSKSEFYFCVRCAYEDIIVTARAIFVTEVGIGFTWLMGLCEGGIGFT